MDWFVSIESRLPRSLLTDLYPFISHYPPHSSIQSTIHSLLKFIHLSFTIKFIHSFIHHSLIHSFIYHSPFHSFVHHSLRHSFIHYSLFYSFIHHSLRHSFIHSSFTSSFIHLTFALVGGGSFWPPPLWFFEDNSKTKRSSVTKLGIPFH